MVPPGLGIVSFSSLGFLAFFAAVAALYLTSSAAMVIVDEIWGNSTRYARVYWVRR
jgi:hypothetical protein